MASTLCLAVGWLVAAASAATGSGAPHRLHLQATDDPTEIIVWWMTPQETPTSFVRFGESEWGARTGGSRVAEGNGPPSIYSEPRDSGGFRSEFIHVVKLRGLPAREVVHYSVGHPDSGWSEPRQFMTRSQSETAQVKIVAFGDQDITRDARDVVNRVLLEDGEPPSFVWLLGDLSYASTHEPSHAASCH
mmetsp:Transcript_12661/g.35618  ORF Transcript_12661/g.35618 Transcript_12661/m.35618 type:complete len:190 (-) Transcript_12661:146-715(-)